jgi:hypothetical protein
MVAMQRTSRQRVNGVKTVFMFLLVFCFALHAHGQIVTATRIDAQPAGHPLDTGSAFDPVWDGATRDDNGGAGG